MKLPPNYKTVIDELGAVQAKLADMDTLTKPLRDREKELRESVLGWCGQLSGDQEAGFEGARYSLTVSARRIERKVKSMARLMAKLGESLFFRHCSVPVKWLDKQLTPAELKRFVSEEYAGARTITTAPRMGAIKGKAA
jgi:hypothetical protein